jgi:hypothetical protein
MPQSLESQVDTLGKLMDTIRKEFAALEKQVDHNDKQAFDVINNLTTRAMKLEQFRITAEKDSDRLAKQVDHNDKQAFDVINNLTTRVMALEKEAKLR